MLNWLFNFYQNKSILGKSQVELDNTAYATTTGLNREDLSFDWKIQHFNAIASTAGLANGQRIVATVPPGSNEIETKWKLSLQENNPHSPSIRTISLRYELDVGGIPEKSRADIYSSLSASYRTAIGSQFQSSSPSPQQGLNKHRGFVDILWYEGISIPEGCVPIHITLSVFTPRPQLQSEFAGLINQERFLLERHGQDMYRLQNGVEWAGADVKLISMEGDEHSANKAILSVRSPVFAAMFKSKLEESKSGVVKLEDISNSTLAILLQYINNGKIRWDQIRSLEEFEHVVYVAEKYELEDLRQYCDILLAANWTMFTAAEIAELAQRFRLEKAAAKIGKLAKHN